MLCIVKKFMDRCIEVIAFSFTTQLSHRIATIYPAIREVGIESPNNLMTNYNIEVSTGKELVVHNNQLKRYHGVVASPSLIPERRSAIKSAPISKQSRRLDHFHCEYNSFPTVSFSSLAPTVPVSHPKPNTTGTPTPQRCLPTNFLPTTPDPPLKILSTLLPSFLALRPILLHHLVLGPLLRVRTPIRRLLIRIYNLVSYGRELHPDQL